MNKESKHRYTVFNAISRGVFYRLVLLAAFKKSNIEKIVDELYFRYAKALVVGGLTKKDNFPILSS